MRYHQEVIERGIRRWAKEAWEKEWVDKEKWCDQKELVATLVSEIWPQRVYKASEYWLRHPWRYYQNKRSG
jgi:hypothetical protein